jgi:adenylate cyclase
MERRLVAILAADAAGYSSLMEIDEERTRAAFGACRSTIAEIVATHHGRIFGCAGDSMMAEFASPVEAVRAAVDIQNDLAKRPLVLPESRQMQFRIGINLGDVVDDQGELFGDGINVAARLQALADPGGILISASVREHMVGRLRLTFDDLGAHEVKNIATPVHVFRVQVDASSVAVPFAMPLPCVKPSIAVLPFTNMSRDTSEDYFADSITENIITNLSRFRDLAVIARHSTFAYKGKRVTIREVSRALGVRYILEGSVQMSGSRVRIVAQLIDGDSSEHLWTERYDRPAENVFAVQDEVTETIVGTLATGYGGRLRKAWRGRAIGAGQRQFQAFDYFLRGIEHEDRFTKEDNRRARQYFGKAARLDPHYAKAIAKLAWSHTFDALFGWSSDSDKSWAKALKFATMSVKRDDDEAWGHWALGGYYLFRGQLDLAYSEYRRAIDLNPNDADILADFAYCLSYSGQPDKSLEMVKRAMRLNPHYPEWYAEALGHAQYESRKYKHAAATLTNLRTIDTVLVHLYAAASYAALGHVEAAQTSIRRALAIDPQANLERWTRSEKTPYKSAKDLERFRYHLRKAGLPN